MSWPAKYFVAQASIAGLTASVDTYLGGRLSESDDTQTPQGFKGMDYYLSFWIRNVAGGLMVAETEAEDGSQVMHVIAYAVPSLFGRSKALVLQSRLVRSVAIAAEFEARDPHDSGPLSMVETTPVPTKTANATVELGILEGIVGSVPGAQELPFPDGPRAGDLTFI